MATRLYLVTYDIRDERRLRRLFRLLKGYGTWVQYSVFQCRLSRRRRAELQAAIDELIHHQDDHVLLIDLGLASQAELGIVSLGRPFRPLELVPVIV